MKTIIVSNRLPFHIKIENNSIEKVSSVGGLATGINGLRDGNTLWVGWPGLAEEDIPCDDLKDEMVEMIIKKDCIPVCLTNHDLKNYYNGFCNKTLWPLFHYFTEYVEYSKKTWESYKNVNKKFADDVIDYAEKDNLIWVHDYHLMLVPYYIKQRRPELSIGFFLHIPFPSFEIFRILPCREKLLEGLLAADLIGFHTHDYQSHFLKTVSNLLDVEIHCNTIKYKGTVTRLRCFPMGIDVEKFAKDNVNENNENENSSLQKELTVYKHANPDVALILSIDRMDYTKGIPQRIKAFSYFLKKYPQYREKVKLLMLAVPSRSGIPQYQLLKNEVHELVGNINGHYRTINWSPIWYFYRELPFTDLVDLYRSCRIALLTPIRDGMNLVAKEYIASRVNNTGVLILSEMAGAAKEMGEAILINPNNYEEVARAIVTALEMPLTEQKRRNEILREKLKKQDVHTWAKDFLNELKYTQHNTQPAAQYLDENVLDEILASYKTANKRAFLLDYDGTLVDFKNRPEDAYPDSKLIDLIRKISSDSKNDITIISGRDRHTLEDWFKNLRITLIAEHGAYLHECYKYDWCSTGSFSSHWIADVRQLLQQFVDRTPGSFIEQKAYSIAWHYRMADSEIGSKHAKELFSLLHRMAENENINIIDGDKVLEIVNNEVNKGVAVQQLLKNKQVDFIISIGDDKTDEFMFEKLRNCGATIKVGTAATSARYYVRDTQEVRKLLRKFVSASRKVNMDEILKKQHLNESNPAGEQISIN